MFLKPIYYENQIFTVVASPCMAMLRSCIAMLLIAPVMFSCSSRQDVKPPVAEKIPQEVFGNRIDNYFWMRLGDEQKSASAPDEQTTRVIGYLNAENAYTTSVLSHTVELQNNLYNELTGRIKQDDESVPYPDNGYYYYNKYSEGKEYPVYYRKKGSVDAPDELLLDVNKIAEGQKYCSVAGLKVSRNNRYMAYSVDLISRRRYTLTFHRSPDNATASG